MLDDLSFFLGRIAGRQEDNSRLRKHQERHGARDRKDSMQANRPGNGYREALRLNVSQWEAG